MAYLFILIELSTSLIVCISCLLIHFRQHFRLQCCDRHYTKPVIPQLFGKLTNKFGMDSDAVTPELELPSKNPQFVANRSSLFSRETLRHPEDAIQWCLRPIDDEEFNFFPRSFLWYQLFLICLISLIICRFIQLLVDNDNNEFINYQPHYYENFNISFAKSNASLTRFDWIIIYSILILINWESLFVFYRYYSTTYSAKYFNTVSNIAIFRVFACYSLPFICLCVAQIHFYFWLFPIIIVLTSGFVLFCTWKTSDILIAQCKRMSLMMGRFDCAPTANSSLVASVYFMRRSSFISCICSIVYLSLFLITYNVNILFYLPIIWSIISISFTLNFIRNRHFVVDTFSPIYIAIFKQKQLGLKHINTGSKNGVRSPTVDSGNGSKNYKIDIGEDIQHIANNNINNNNNAVNDTSKNQLQPYNNTLTTTWTAINHSIECKANAPEFGLDILFDVNGEIIDENDGTVFCTNTVTVTRESSPKSGLNSVIINNCEDFPAPILFMADSVSFKKSGSLKYSNRLPKPINLPQNGKLSKSLSKSNSNSSLSRKPAAYEPDFSALGDRIDSDTKRKILAVRGKWRKKFESYKKTTDVAHADDIKFAKSQPIKTECKEVRLMHPDYSPHRNIAADNEKPSLYKPAHSNPLPVPVAMTMSSSKPLAMTKDDSNLPRFGLAASDPVSIKRTKLLCLQAKQSKHAIFNSFQPGDIDKLNSKLKHNKRQSFSRKLIFNKLPTEIQQLPDLEKKKVEEFANLHLCMSLHGFCEKNTLFEFQQFSIEYN